MKVLSAAAAVVVIATAMARPIAATQPSDPTSGTGVSLADALEFRSTFGFSTDMDKVAATMKDPAADTTWAADG